MSQPLAGRNAIITGASQGLGLAIAKAYVTAGASVLMCARGAAELEAAREAVASGAESSQQIDAVPADVSKEADVKAFPRSTSS